MIHSNSFFDKNFYFFWLWLILLKVSRYIHGTQVYSYMLTSAFNQHYLKKKIFVTNKCSFITRFTPTHPHCLNGQNPLRMTKFFVNAPLRQLVGFRYGKKTFSQNSDKFGQSSIKTVIMFMHMLYNQKKKFILSLFKTDTLNFTLYILTILTCPLKDMSLDYII